MRERERKREGEGEIDIYRYGREMRERKERVVGERYTERGGE